VFLEAPAGVGFSYSADGNYRTDDDQVASDNHLAIKHFFLKFPQFKSNPFYITGESYGGIYVPTLTVNVFRGSPDINLKGFAVGNGYFDSEKLGNSLIFFGYYHGLIGDSSWSQLVKFCCQGSAGRDSCNFVRTSSPECQEEVNKASAVIRGNNLNIYNLYQDCDNAPSNSERRGLSREHLDRKLVFRSIHGSNASFPLGNSVGDSPPCVDDSFVGKWVNQPSVRAALHIPSHVQNWDICSSAVEQGYTTLYSTMKPQVLELIGSGKLRGMVYNGDVDMACNFLGDQWFVDDLGLEVTDEYKEWTLDGQVGGFVKHFKNLVFVTIRGSGHMVPQDKPGPAFKLISTFIGNSSLTHN
jgi:cathepsin A (carboxypeptidase C)